MIQIAQMNIPVDVQKLFFPFAFIGFGIFTALFPFHTWVPDGHSSAPTAASMFLAGISMKLGGYGCLRVATYLNAGCRTCIFIDHYFAGNNCYYLWCIRHHDAEGSEIYQCIFIGQPLRICVAGYWNANTNIYQWCSIANGIAWINDSSFLCCHRHDLQQNTYKAGSTIGWIVESDAIYFTVFVIAGLCSLGLPGLSGFVAEMTVFMGSWQNPDKWYRLATILACASIVVTAVYILRATGKTIMGPMSNAYEKLTDATWNEKLAAGIIDCRNCGHWCCSFLINRFDYTRNRNNYE